MTERKHNEEEAYVRFQQYLTLGMAASKKFPEYETIARLEPETAKCLYILDHWEELFHSDKTMLQIARDIIFNMGVIDGLNRFGELTHLSMIVGDQTKTRSAKNVRDKLTRAANK